MGQKKKGGKSAPAKKTAAPAESQKEEVVISPRSVTAICTSYKLSRDIKFEQFTLSLHGSVLVQDAELELNYGRRYGLIGLNGSGKTSIMYALGHRELPVPEHISIFHLEREAAASDKSALEAVVEDVESERIRLEAEAEELVASEEGANSERLMSVYERLDELDVDTATKRAGEILFGLGFNTQMQNKKTKEFSGGWRMRIALAKALFMRPMMLLLDEPTNHLDLEACVWLEEYLKNYNRILLLVSHSQDFLNGVCTNIMHLKDKKLSYYTGNFDTYVKTRAEKEENQMKQYNWEQDQIAHMKNYIARFGHGSAKLARQAQSKEKVLAKMEAKGLTEKVSQDKVLVLQFYDPGTLPPPVVQFNHVHFGYSPDPKDELYSDLDFGVDLDSRIALVGPNGVGKSTLLKLMVGKLVPTQGMVRRHQHLRFGWYHQHLTDQLDLNLTPLEYMLKEFPGELEAEKMRSVIGRFGITGKSQTVPMKQLSDGQKSRVVFAWLAFSEPHLLLLDEPTNHLDIETIDALAAAINDFPGGMVLVSHDFRLINQVAKEIWVCEKRTVTKWKGDIISYKESLREKMLAQSK
jgi:ATP-binding cassette subfamily F protein 2